MKHTFLFSLLLMIMNAGSLFSQTTQNEVQEITIPNQLVADQQHQQEITQTVKESKAVVNKANITAYSERQLNRFGRRRCYSAHSHGAHQEAFAKFNRGKSLKYKKGLTQTVLADKNNNKNK